MHLLNAWKESLSILKPANLKLFLLVTLKSVIDVYKLIFKKFWVMLLAIIFASVTIPVIIRMYTSPFMGFTDYFGWVVGGMAGPEITSFVLLLVLLEIFILFSICLIECFMYLLTRPSVHLKNYRYLFGYAKHCMYIFFYKLFFKTIAIILSISLTFLALELVDWVFLNKTILSLIDASRVAGATLWAFFILFMLDSDGTISSSIKSLWRACKMWMLNFPICIILSCIVVYGNQSILFVVQKIIMILGSRLFGLEHININSPYALYFFYFLGTLIACIIAPIFICLITNFYFKRLHEQCNEYYHTNG